MKQRKQSSTSYPIPIFMVLSDHVTPATGKTVSVSISKNGGSFAAAAGAVSEIGNGWYQLAANAADRNTVGELAIRATATGCDETPDRYTIVPWDPFDGTNLGLAHVDASVTSRAPASTAVSNADYTSSRAAKLDNLDAAVTSRAPASTAVSNVDYTTGRAAKLDNLDTSVSSRLAAGAYIPPDNTSITQIEAVLDGITSLADWLRTLIRADAADPVAKAEINAGGGTFDEAKHSLVRAATLAELLEADRYIDTTVTPWALVLTRKNSGGPGVGVELLRQRLQTETGANVTSISTFVGRSAA